MRTLLLFTFLFNSLYGSAQEWSAAAGLTTAGRDDGIAFSLNGNGYVVTGNLNGYTESNKLFQYNPFTDSWTEKSSFPGTARQYAACFTIENNAYLIGGYSENGNALNDVWVYDGTNDNWSQKTDFPGLPRWHSTALTIQETGYFGMGTTVDSTLSDLWKYNHSTDEWIRLANYPGGGMRSVLGFPIQNKGVFGQGFSIDPITYSAEWFQFDPNTESWSNFNAFPGGMRSYGTAVSNGLTAVVCGGMTETGTFENDCYSIDYAGTWKSLPNLPNNGLKGSKGFHLGENFYVGTGIDQSNNRTSDFNKLEIVDFEKDKTILFPNPSKDDFTLVTQAGATVFVYTTNGRLLKEMKVPETGFVMLEGLMNGIYVLSIEGVDLFEVRKIAKI